MRKVLIISVLLAVAVVAITSYVHLQRQNHDLAIRGQVGRLSIQLNSYISHHYGPSSQHWVRPEGERTRSDHVYEEAFRAEKLATSIWSRSGSLVFGYTASARAVAASAKEAQARRASLLEMYQSTMWRAEKLRQATSFGEAEKIGKELRSAVDLYHERARMLVQALEEHQESIRGLSALLIISAPEDAFRDLDSTSALRMDEIQNLLKDELNLVKETLAGHVYSDPNATTLFVLFQIQAGNPKDALQALQIRPVNVAWVDSNGNSILHIAAAMGFHEVVAALIAAGASVDLLNREAQSAAQLGRVHGFDYTF